MTEHVNAAASGAQVVIRPAQSWAQFAIQALLLAGILTVLVLGTLGLLRPSTVSAVESWEYIVEGIPDPSFGTMMDELGEQGWELVFARRAIGAGDESLYECIFKRRK